MQGTVYHVNLIHFTGLDRIELKTEVYIHLGWNHLNLFFYHSTNVLLTNYSFGTSVRTSTLCMTQVYFSNNCLQTDYFTYYSLCQNSSGSEVYIH